MNKKILIITNSHDLHVDRALSIFENKFFPAFRFNLDRFPSEYQVTQMFYGADIIMRLEHTPSGETIDLDSIKAIWSRKPADFSFASNDDLSVQEKAYSKGEAEHALFSLFYSLNCFWMSHPLALRGSMWKGEQLLRAKRYGFKIPATLTTNKPSDVLRFNRRVPGNMIFKSLSGPDLASSEVDDEAIVASGLTTTIVTSDMLQEIDSVRALPCHFQEYIPKKYELRVTVVGNSVFAAKLYSQDDNRTKVDSRDMSAEIRYEATVLPDVIHKRCLEFVKSYGLNYSALDIIVTPDEDYVFLENNPNGQFLYIEELIPEFNILETVADTLITSFREGNEQYFRSAAY